MLDIRVGMRFVAFQIKGFLMRANINFKPLNKIPDPTEHLHLAERSKTLVGESTLNKEEICWATSTAQKSFVEAGGTTPLIKTVGAAIEKLCIWREAALTKFARLTHRQHQIMLMLLAGKANKVIAADLGLSQRTVAHHCSMILQKTGVKSVAALARLALTASWMAPLPASAHI